MELDTNLLTESACVKPEDSFIHNLRNSHFLLKNIYIYNIFVVSIFHGLEEI